MTFTQTTDLFLNLSGPQHPAQFFTGPASLKGTSGVQWVQGDCVLLRLWLCVPRIMVGATHELARANGPIALAVKNRVGGDALMAFASDFNLVAGPDGDHYEAVLDLNTEELLAALTGNTPSLAARMDIELQGPGNTRRITFTRDVQIVRQSYQGNEVEPVPATPPYPAPGDIPSKNGLDALVEDKVEARAPTIITAAVEAAVTAAMPGVLVALHEQMATLVSTAVANAVDKIPRLHGVTAKTLEPGQPATVEKIPWYDAVPEVYELRFGIPKGAAGEPGKDAGGSVQMGDRVFEAAAFEIHPADITSSTAGTAPPMVVRPFTTTPEARHNEVLTCTIAKLDFSTLDPAPDVWVLSAGPSLHRASFAVRLSGMPDFTKAAYTISYNLVYTPGPSK